MLDLKSDLYIAYADHNACGRGEHDEAILFVEAEYT